MAVHEVASRLAEGKAGGGERAARAVFISYSHRNRDLKLRVEAALRAAGMRPALTRISSRAPTTGPTSALLIRSSTLTVVLYHEAFSTRWVADEAHLADELANRDGRLRYIGVISIRAGLPLPFPLTNRQNLNLSQDGLSAEGMQRLCRRRGAVRGAAGDGTARAIARPRRTAGRKRGRRRRKSLNSIPTPCSRHDPGASVLPDALSQGRPPGRPEARLAALTSPVQRWRKRMIGGGAAIAGALTLMFTGYPVLKELTTSPNAVMERAAEEAPELAAAIAPEPEAPVPAPAAEQTAAPEPPAPAAADVGPVTPPPMLALATLASPAAGNRGDPPTPGTPVSPATLSTLAPPAAKADPLLASDTKSFDLDLSPLIEACDLRRGPAAMRKS